jgi:hypothetical protein
MMASTYWKNQRSMDLSDTLEQIYMADDNVCKIQVYQGRKLLFDEEGYLLKQPDQYGIYTYHINGADLEEVLFELVDDEIVIDVEAGGKKYRGTNQNS